jgi:serine/threonine protein kinase
MTHTTVNRKTGTPRWQAPELLPDMTSDDASSTERHNTRATDIYAFALVCYEVSEICSSHRRPSYTSLQMFSGEYPFQDISNDFQVIFAVQRGRRPSQPSTDLSRTRCLNDELWHIIEACWAKEPSERPTASEIAKRLRALPNRPVDRRPLDDWIISFPSQILPKELGHPFSTLTASTEEHHHPLR